MVNSYNKNGIKRATKAIFNHYISSSMQLMDNNSVHNKMFFSYSNFIKLGDGTKDTLKKYKFVKEGFVGVNYDSFKEWDYYHECSMVITQATILDVFLSDINRMLFHAFPIRVSKDVQVSARDVLDTDDLKKLQDQIIEGRVFAHGMKNFQTRIEKINNTHTLKASIPTCITDKLEEMADIRHKIVHQRSNVQVKSTKTGRFYLEKNDEKITDVSKKYFTFSQVSDFCTKMVIA